MSTTTRIADTNNSRGVTQLNRSLGAVSSLAALAKVSQTKGERSSLDFTGLNGFLVVPILSSSHPDSASVPTSSHFCF